MRFRDITLASLSSFITIMIIAILARILMDFGSNTLIEFLQVFPSWILIIVFEVFYMLLIYTIRGK